MGQPRTPPADRDTTGSRRLLDRWNFHPVYTSQYQLNRTSRTWSQGLTINRSAGPFDLSNQWSVALSSDEARSDFRSKRGRMTATLDYKHDGFGGWTVGLDGTFSRNSQLSSFQDKVGDTDNVGLAVGSELLERMIHGAVPALSGIRFELGGDIGLSRENNVDRRSSRVDTTRVRSLYQGYDLGLSGKVRQVTLRASMITDRSTGNSTTIQRDVRTGGLT
ncbi:MAG: hypothetical protein GF346_10835, partial [Candidatus Eisenbacteria bacterium]|nr:hypothetical protein [Candidatus Latescibacterota bacterium]MBD3302932.1 hypothetical protein [Candidatus Eisenbacteria bacterium]